MGVVGVYWCFNHHAQEHLMVFMNDYDIDDALQRFESHPVLGPASRTMAELRDWTNSNSDGWAYWPLPQRAADKLMTLIMGDGTSKYYRTDRDDVTADDLKVALRPIKSFRTKQGADFQIVEELPDPVDQASEPTRAELTMPERLANKHVRLDKAMIPPSIVDLGMDGKRQVVAAVYLPYSAGYLPAHLVVYYRGNGNEFTGVSPTDQGWAVSLMVNNGDERVLTQGDYDLTFAEAMTRFTERLQKQA